jgi:hypothetical protein
MADDDETTLSDEDQSFLLSGTSSLGDSVDFRAATGIDVRNLSSTVIGTLAFGLAAAATIFVQGVTEAWTIALDGVTAFIAGTRELVTGTASNLAPGPVYRDVPGLIGTLADTWISAMRGAWSSAVPDSGFATFLFALGIVLITFYAAARGVDTVSEVLR